MTDQAKRVAIFGAGISGLTAAHELVERGFDVEVFEPAAPSSVERTCSVGGMARTQWAHVPLPETDDGDGGPPPPTPVTEPFTAPSTEPLPWELERAFMTDDGEPLRIFFEDGTTDLTTEGAAALATFGTFLADNAAEYGSWPIDVRGYVHDRGTEPFGTGLDKERADHVKELLETDYGVTNALTAVGLGFGRRDDWTVSDAERDYVDFKLDDDRIPGEHGFRFFPTFYRNLRDTLARTPIARDGDPFVETPRTVLDNVIPTTQQGFNLRVPKPSYVMPRRRLRSAQEFFTVLTQALASSEFTFSDIQRWQLVLFKYMTSCGARRSEYEQLSWWEFADGDAFSPIFQEHLANTPQALVAMSAKECDARTFGDITLQILTDQLTDGAQTDGTLNGPTSVAWFAHWRRYLERQGVRFRRGELQRFETVDSAAWPVVDLIADDGSVEEDVHVVRDYYVLAVPVQSAPALVDGLAGDDFDRIRALELGELSQAKPDGQLQHLSGIQFYFPSELKLVRGHTIYPDAEWGLSSIFQPQFWTRKRGWWDGYRGLLTVGIGNWYRDSPRLEKPAWDSTRDEIAAEVWQQILETFTPEQQVKLAHPILYHLDDNIEFERAGDLPSGNKTPMLINWPGRYRERPGDLAGYAVHYDSLVVAGTYMQTNFRLTTMEAANESGRHAVNAILDHAQFAGDRCEIVRSEDHEFDDLAIFIDLDAALHAAGLPHFLDILRPQALDEAWLSGDFDLTSLGIPPLP